MTDPLAAALALLRDVDADHQAPEVIRAHVNLAIDRIEAISALPPEPPPGHVRVRIAVETTDDRDVWAAVGWNGSTFEDEREELGRWLGDPGRISYVTADVPLPEAPAEVVGTVEGEP